MKKFKIIFIIIFFSTLFHSCTTLKEGFESQRKNSTDEFMVEKKKPLVMPPDFEKLPIPGQNKTDSEQENIKQIQELIVTDGSKNTNPKNTDQKTENFILDKIKIKR